VAYLRGLADDFESGLFPDWVAGHFEFHTEKEIVFLADFKGQRVSWRKLG
jgi:hypothetical protein